MGAVTITQKAIKELRVGEVDEAEFSRLVEMHHRELHVHSGLVAALAGAAGVHLEVDGDRIPTTGVAVMTDVVSLIGVVLAAALPRWSARPTGLFVRIALALTALSLVPPLVWADDAAVAATLVVLHLVAAAVMIPALARSLQVS